MPKLSQKNVLTRLLANDLSLSEAEYTDLASLFADFEDAKTLPELWDTTENQPNLTNLEKINKQLKTAIETKGKKTAAINSLLVSMKTYINNDSIYFNFEDITKKDELEQQLGQLLAMPTATISAAPSEAASAAMPAEPTAPAAAAAHTELSLTTRPTRLAFAPARESGPLPDPRALLIPRPMAMPPASDPSLAIVPVAPARRRQTPAADRMPATAVPPPPAATDPADPIADEKPTSEPRAAILLATVAAPAPGMAPPPPPASPEAAHGREPFRERATVVPPPPSSAVTGYVPPVPAPRLRSAEELQNEALDRLLGDAPTLITDDDCTMIRDLLKARPIGALPARLGSAEILIANLRKIVNNLQNAYNERGVEVASLLQNIKTFLQQADAATFTDYKINQSKAMLQGQINRLLALIRTSTHAAAPASHGAGAGSGSGVGSAGAPAIPTITLRPRTFTTQKDVDALIAELKKHPSPTTKRTTKPTLALEIIKALEAYQTRPDIQITGRDLKRFDEFFKHYSPDARLNVRQENIRTRKDFINALITNTSSDRVSQDYLQTVHTLLHEELHLGHIPATSAQLIALYNLYRLRMPEKLEELQRFLLARSNQLIHNGKCSETDLIASCEEYLKKRVLQKKCRGLWIKSTDEIQVELNACIQASYVFNRIFSTGIDIQFFIEKQDHFSSSANNHLHQALLNRIATANEIPHSLASESDTLCSKTTDGFLEACAHSYELSGCLAASTEEEKKQFSNLIRQKAALLIATGATFDKLAQILKLSDDKEDEDRQAFEDFTRQQLETLFIQRMNHTFDSGLPDPQAACAALIEEFKGIYRKSGLGLHHFCSLTPSSSDVVTRHQAFIKEKSAISYGRQTDQQKLTEINSWLALYKNFNDTLAEFQTNFPGIGASDPKYPRLPDETADHFEKHLTTIETLITSSKNRAIAQQFFLENLHVLIKTFSTLSDGEKTTRVEAIKQTLKRLNINPYTFVQQSLIALTNVDHDKPEEAFKQLAIFLNQGFFEPQEEEQLIALIQRFAADFLLKGVDPKTLSSFLGNYTNSDLLVIRGLAKAGDARLADTAEDIANNLLDQLNFKNPALRAKECRDIFKKLVALENDSIIGSNILQEHISSPNEGYKNCLDLLAAGVEFTELDRYFKPMDGNPSAEIIDSSGKIKFLNKKIKTALDSLITDDGKLDSSFTADQFRLLARALATLNKTADEDTAVLYETLQQRIYLNTEKLIAEGLTYPELYKLNPRLRVQHVLTQVADIEASSAAASAGSGTGGGPATASSAAAPAPSAPPAEHAATTHLNNLKDTQAWLDARLAGVHSPTTNPEYRINQARTDFQALSLSARARIQAIYSSLPGDPDAKKLTLMSLIEHETRQLNERLTADADNKRRLHDKFLRLTRETDTLLHDDMVAMAIAEHSRLTAYFDSLPRESYPDGSGSSTTNIAYAMKPEVDNLHYLIFDKDTTYQRLALQYKDALTILEQRITECDEHIKMYRAGKATELKELHDTLLAQKTHLENLLKKTDTLSTDITELKNKIDQAHAFLSNRRNTTLTRIVGGFESTTDISTDTATGTNRNTYVSMRALNPGEHQSMVFSTPSASQTDEQKGQAVEMNSGGQSSLQILRPEVFAHAATKEDKKSYYQNLFNLVRQYETNVLCGRKEAFIFFNAHTFEASDEQTKESMLQTLNDILVMLSFKTRVRATVLGVPGFTPPTEEKRIALLEELQRVGLDTETSAPLTGEVTNMTEALRGVDRSFRHRLGTPAPCRYEGPGYPSLRAGLTRSS